MSRYEYQCTQRQISDFHFPAIDGVSVAALRILDAGATLSSTDTAHWPRLMKCFTVRTVDFYK